MEIDELISKLSEIGDEIGRRTKSIFRSESYCFDKQISFINDSNPFKVAVCSRRSGKTIACAAHLIEEATTKENRVCLYITLSRNNAKKIIWKDLLNINRKFDLGGRIDNTELSISFSNGSSIYLSGAKDKSEIEKFRGLAISLCYIDECGSFRDYIRDLVDDIIAPALMDYSGSLCLIGTPSPVPTGYFYECWTNKEWSKHGWTFFDNPFIVEKSQKTHQEILNRELSRRGVTIDHPSIQREFFGKWCMDADSLVFKYNPIENDYKTLPDMSDKWSYIVGVDIGHDDADAIAVIGFHKYLKQSYLVKEILNTKQGITELASQLQKVIDEYKPDKIVADTGGLGKKIAHEMQKRFSLPIVAAEKDRKYEFIEILNDAMRTKSFFAKASSRFAQDCSLVEWDLDKSVNGKLVISDRYHSDINDAVLYAFRESLHWLSEDAPKKIEYLSDDWHKMEVEEMERVALEALKNKEVEGYYEF